MKIYTYGMAIIGPGYELGVGRSRGCHQIPGLFIG